MEHARRDDDLLLRTTMARMEQWGDKTMSMLRERQLEACQERLTRCPSQGIFTALCQDEAQALFHFSFYAKETQHRRLDQETLQARVLHLVEKEACFLSPREDELVKRMLIGGGVTPLESWEEISAAEALISRLWCTLENSDQDAALLRLEQPLIQPITQAMLSTQYLLTRERIFSFDATLHSLLYLSGFLHAAAPMAHFQQNWKGCPPEITDILIARYLRAAFDYTQTMQGEILLLHPGLAEPERLLATLEGMKTTETHLTREMMLGGMNGILPEEVASCEAMRGAMAGAVRPEFDESEALEDLRMMAKQGARLSEMREVLESMLCVLPTPQMLSALSQLHLQTVRWIGMPSAVLN